MRVVYHCYGGTHSSVLGAALHLCLIDPAAVPNDIRALPFFDKATSSDVGRLRLMGIDEFGNRVFVLGRRKRGSQVEEALRSFGTAWGVRDWLFVDTSTCVGPYLRVGGFLSRRLGIARLGLPLLTRGAGDTLRALGETVASSREVSQHTIQTDLPERPRRIIYSSGKSETAMGAALLHLGKNIEAVTVNSCLSYIGRDTMGTEIYGACLKGIIERKCVSSWLSEEGLIVAEGETKPGWDVFLVNLESCQRMGHTIPKVVEVIRAATDHGKEELP